MIVDIRNHLTLIILSSLYDINNVGCLSSFLFQVIKWKDCGYCQDSLIMFSKIAKIYPALISLRRMFRNSVDIVYRRWYKYQFITEMWS